MGLPLILTKKIEYKYINFKITLKYFMDLGVYLDMPLVFLYKKLNPRQIYLCFMSY